MGRSELVSQQPLGVAEASAVAALGDGAFLVVSDEDGLFRCKLGAPPTHLAVSDKLTDLEGLCFIAERSEALALTEHDASVWRFPLVDGELAPGHRLGSLPEIGTGHNSGWEGIAYAAAGVLADTDLLVAVHQERPRRIGLFDAKTLAERAILRLPKDARKRLDDLNDVTVDPKTHHLLVLSGKAGCIAELRLVGLELELVQLYPIETAKRDVPEGITFDPAGRLWIVTDGQGMLREIRLDKTSAAPT